MNRLTFPAGSPKGQSGVNLVLDFDESIEHHRATVVQIHSVLLHTRLVTRLVRVLEAGREGEGVGGQVERKRERERERGRGERKD